MKKHKEWLAETIQMAMQNAEEGGGPFAALVVLGDQIVGKGVNQTHLQHDPTAHAELLAIREACITLGRTDLANAILYASGEPCPMCMGAIYWAKPKAIYYACSKKEAAEAVQFSDPLTDFYQEMKAIPASRSIPMVKLDVEQKLTPFHTWHKKHHKG